MYAQYGIVAVRGCEVEGYVGADGHLIDEQFDEHPSLSKTNNRTLRVCLDTNQFYNDQVCAMCVFLCACMFELGCVLLITGLDSCCCELQNNIQAGAPNIYDVMHVIVRRDARENNFKAVLESIRDLMNGACVV
jgi:intron-binding protein aquarius